MNEPFLEGLGFGCGATVLLLAIYYRINPMDFYSRKDRAIIAYFYNDLDELQRLHELERLSQFPPQRRPYALWAKIIFWAIGAFAVLIFGLTVFVFLTGR